MDLTYIDNVVHSIQLAIKNVNKHSGEAFNITNDKPVKLWDFINEFLVRTDRDRIKKKVNYKIVFYFAYFLELFYKIFLPSKEPIITRYSCSFLAKSQTLDISKAKKLLNYSPIVDMNEGLTRYVEWSKKEGTNDK